jgi:hypothetical protein
MSVQGEYYLNPANGVAACGKSDDKKYPFRVEEVKISGSFQVHGDLLTIGEI